MDLTRRFPERCVGGPTGDDRAGEDLLVEVLGDPSAEDAEDRLAIYFASTALENVLATADDLREDDLVAASVSSGGIVNLGMWLAVEAQSYPPISARAGPNAWMTNSPSLGTTSFSFGNGAEEVCSGPYAVPDAADRGVRDTMWIPVTLAAATFRILRTLRQRAPVRPGRSGCLGCSVGSGGSMRSRW